MTKYTLKDTKEQPDEAIHRAWSGRSLGASVHMALVYTTSQYVDVCTNLEAPRALYFGDFYGEVIT